MSSSIEFLIINTYTLIIQKLCADLDNISGDMRLCTVQINIIETYSRNLFMKFIEKLW